VVAELNGLKRRWNPAPPSSIPHSLKKWVNSSSFFGRCCDILLGQSPSWLSKFDQVAFTHPQLLCTRAKHKNYKYIEIVDGCVAK
jgi:hypothetical protein